MNSVISVSDFYFNYLRSDLVLKNVNIFIPAAIMQVRLKYWANRQKGKRFPTWP